MIVILIPVLFFFQPLQKKFIFMQSLTNKVMHGHKFNICIGIRHKLFKGK